MTLHLPSMHSDEPASVTLGDTERRIAFSTSLSEAFLVVKMPEMEMPWEFGLGRGRDIDELIHCLSLLRSRMPV